MRAHEIFWTGGFDSTFRVIQLSQQPIVVRPVYILGANWRKSEAYELRAISQIYNVLKFHPETKASFLPVRLLCDRNKLPDLSICVKTNNEYPFELCEMPSNRAVIIAWRKLYIRVQEINKKNGFTTKAFDRLSGVDNNELLLANQYIATAIYANTVNNIEMAFTKSDTAILGVLKRFGHVISLENGNFVLDTTKSDVDLLTLFEHISFPLLGFTKLDLKAKYKKAGYDQIANLTWFCYDPIDDEPCGQCWTCLHTFRDGIKDRFSPAALERYYRREAELSQTSINSTE